MQESMLLITRTQAFFTLITTSKGGVENFLSRPKLLGRNYFIACDRGSALETSENITMEQVRNKCTSGRSVMGK